MFASPNHLIFISPLSMRYKETVLVLSSLMQQNIREKQLKEERGRLGSQSREDSLSWWEDTGSCRRWLVACVHSQEAENNKYVCSEFFIYLNWDQSLWNSLGWVFSPQWSNLDNLSQICPEICLESDTRYPQINNWFKSSHIFISMTNPPCLPRGSHIQSCKHKQ